MWVRDAGLHSMNALTNVAVFIKHASNPITCCVNCLEAKKNSNITFTLKDF